MSNDVGIDSDLEGQSNKIQENLRRMQKEKKVNEAREQGREHRRANEAGTGTPSGKMTEEQRKKYEGTAASGNMSPEEKAAYKEGYSEG